MKPFFTFFGGKYRAAPHYPQPTHGTVIEPFAGSAGYSVRNYHLDIRLNDEDPTIAGLWDYLINVSAAEIRSLPAVVQHVSEVPGPQEARSLVGFWLNKGHTTPCNVPSKWMRDGLRPHSQWGETIRERVASQVDEIRHWKITCGSYDEMPDVPATWYIDPPYEISGKRYRHHKINYVDLGDWCQRRSGQVIVCEQAGALWLPFEPFRDIKALEGKNGVKVSREVIYYRQDCPNCGHGSHDDIRCQDTCACSWPDPYNFASAGQ